MGSTCCAPKNLQYEYDGKTRTIDPKSAKTLDRFSQGASARIQVRNIKTKLAKDITCKSKIPIFQKKMT